MKNILQAAALIIVAASAIVAAATSRHAVHKKCRHEWAKSSDTIQSAGNKNMVHAGPSVNPK